MAHTLAKTFANRKTEIRRKSDIGFRPSARKTAALYKKK